MQNYAILNEEGGWLENIVVWDGNLEKWQPPIKTIAKPESEIDYQKLPQKPE